MLAIAKKDGLRWIEAEFSRLQLVDGRPFLAGPSLSLADILAFCYIEWGDNDRIWYPFSQSTHPTVGAWLERMRQRSSSTV